MIGKAPEALDTLQEIATEFISLRNQVDELQEKVNAGIEIELTDSQVDNIILQIGEEGLKLNSISIPALTFS